MADNSATTTRTQTATILGNGDGDGTSTSTRSNIQSSPTLPTPLVPAVQTTPSTANGSSISSLSLQSSRTTAGPRTSARSNPSTSIATTTSSSVSNTSAGLSHGSIAGIVIAGVILLLLVGGLAFYLGKRQSRRGEAKNVDRLHGGSEKGTESTEEMRKRGSTNATARHEAGGAALHELEMTRSELEGDHPKHGSTKAIEIGVKSPIGTKREV